MNHLPARSPILLVCFVLSLLLLSCPAPQEADTDDEGEEFTLIVLHTNDVHARILEFNSHGNTCNEEESALGECFGGVARTATMIKQLREGKSNTILVDAGDQFQGTLLYTYYKNEPIQMFMNMLGYDVMTLGNHEFDDGPETLADFAQALDFPVISSNIDFENEPLLKDLIQPYYIMEVDDHNIGFVGRTTTDVPSISNPGDNLVFNDIEASVRETVNELQSRDVNIIIALSHAGFAADMELAAAVDGIDIIVGGHTHTFLSNTDEKAEGVYPTMATSPSGEPVLIVQAKAWGMYLGHLEATFDAEGVVAEWSGDPILLDASVPQDEQVLAEALELSNELLPLRLEVVGETLVELGNADEICRYEECAIGNLFCDALLWDTEKEGIQISLFNGGGIRTGIPAGPITMEQVLEVQPFLDTLATFELRGENLRATLEHGVSRAESTQNEGTGRFLQVGGLKYTWDPNQPVGSRIVEVMVRNDDGTFVPLDDEAIYKVACSDYIRNGGDEFDILRHRAIDPYDFGRAISHIFVDYLKEFSPVAPELEGRIGKVE